MRVKTLPRHLPRKQATKIKTAFSTNCQAVSSTKSWPLVRTVNFTTFGDIVEQVDLSCDGKQDPIVREEKAEALDLSRKKRTEAGARKSEDLKDTYLYQLMTDPNFLKQVKGERRAASCCCPYCKKEFGGESELKAHLNVSADEQNQLRCCACGKCFAQKRYLRYHQRSHSERSKYACEICTRKYSRLDNLTRHNIFHTNPDKFPCNSCERTFARKDLLNKHLKCHENKYKYHCDLCQKYFKGPVSLDNHSKLFHANSTSCLQLPTSSFATQTC